MGREESGWENSASSWGKGMFWNWSAVWTGSASLSHAAEEKPLPVMSTAGAAMLFLWLKLFPNKKGGAFYFLSILLSHQAPLVNHKEYNTKRPHRTLPSLKAVLLLCYLKYTVEDKLFGVGSMSPDTTLGRHFHARSGSRERSCTSGWKAKYTPRRRPVHSSANE